MNFAGEHIPDDRLSGPVEPPEHIRRVFSELQAQTSDTPAALQEQSLIVLQLDAPYLNAAPEARSAERIEAFEMIVRRIFDGPIGPRSLGGGAFLVLHAGSLHRADKELDRLLGHWCTAHPSVRPPYCVGLALVRRPSAAAFAHAWQIAMQSLALAQASKRRNYGAGP